MQGHTLELWGQKELDSFGKNKADLSWGWLCRDGQIDNIWGFTCRGKHFWQIYSIAFWSHFWVNESYGKHSCYLGLFSKDQGSLMQLQFRVAISYSCEEPREQRWKCLKCGGGGRKFRKETRVSRLLVKQRGGGRGGRGRLVLLFLFHGIVSRNHSCDPWGGTVSLIFHLCAWTPTRGPMNGLTSCAVWAWRVSALSVGSCALASLRVVLGSWPRVNSESAQLQSPRDCSAFAGFTAVSVYSMPPHRMEPKTGSALPSFLLSPGPGEDREGDLMANIGKAVDTGKGDPKSSYCW